MANTLVWPTKDGADVDTRHVIWCSLDATNDGTASDTGELQGETISTVTWTVPSGITQDSSNQNQTTIQGVTYSANTVCNIILSSGTEGTDYDIECKITTSGGRTLVRTMTQPVAAR